MNCTCELAAYFPTFAFLLRLSKDCGAAPAVANWRCQFAKFSSRVQIEPNARMLVNNKNSAIKSRGIWETFEAERLLVIGKSFKWCGCRLFVCFLICFCHEGGRRVRPVGGWWRPRVLGCPLSRPCAPPQSAPAPGPAPSLPLGLTCTTAPPASKPPGCPWARTQ